MKQRDVLIAFGLLVVSVLLCVDAHAAQFMTGGYRLNKEVKPLREIKHENVVTQSLDFSCGAAGLSTLLNFYLDDPVTELEIIQRLLQVVPLEKVQARRGFSLYDLKRFAQEKGYKVSGYKMDIDFLRDLNRPVLVPIKFKNYSHFVVVKAIIGDRVFLADPAAGNISMLIPKFLDIWTSGIGLVIDDPSSEHRQDYALNVTKNDLVIADYKAIRRITNQALLSIAIHPNEW